MIVYVSSHHDDFVGTVILHGDVTAGKFQLSYRQNSILMHKLNCIKGQSYNSMCACIALETSSQINLRTHVLWRGDVRRGSIKSWLRLWVDIMNWVSSTNVWRTEIWKRNRTSYRYRMHRLNSCKMRKNYIYYHYLLWEYSR